MSTIEVGRRTYESRPRPEDRRTRKRLAAEELAQKAPIKMIFPLASCFFPAILIVAAGPGVLAIMKALGS